MLLTKSDCQNRHPIASKGLSSTKSHFAFAAFERVFKEFGLAQTIRTDNGVPFASPNAFFGLSTLSAWSLHLGIQTERIKPGNPQQNGRHERIHLTLTNAQFGRVTRRVARQVAYIDGPKTF